MSHFEPPVKDMLFALDEFIGLEKLNQLEGLDQEIDREFLSSIYISAAEIAVSYTHLTLPTICSV